MNLYEAIKNTARLNYDVKYINNYNKSRCKVNYFMRANMHMKKRGGGKRLEFWAKKRISAV